MKVSSENLVWMLLVFVCGLMFEFSTLHSFNLWSQVTYLRGADLDSSYISQAHFLRYLLVLPIFLASDYLNLEADLIFRAACFTIIFFIVRNCITIIKFYSQKNIILFIISYSFLFLAMATFMNGRMVFSFLGFSYLVIIIHQWDIRKIENIGLFLRFLPALFLCSVSTGVFLSCIVSIFTFSIFPTKRKKRYYYIYVSLFLAALSPLISLYLFKNIDFYGGGFAGLINMLNHGAGAVFHQFGSVVTTLILLISMISILFCGLIYIHSRTRKLLLLFASTSLICGLFGYSTLTMSIVPLSAILLLTTMDTLKKIIN